MIIEQVEALKVWLTNKLSPICDAEPSALAKYVCALVKKDKPEQDLRDICVDQLDVFLQQNTKQFVDELFEVLKSKLYFPPAGETKPRPPTVAPVKQDVKSPSHQGSKDKEDGTRKKNTEISSTTEDKENKETTTTTSSTTFTVSNSKDSFADSHTRDVKDTSREVREPRATSREGRERDRDRDGSRDRRDSWREDRYRDVVRDSRDGIRDTRDTVRDVRDGRDGIRDARDIIRDREKDRVDVRGGDTREVREPRDRDFRDRDRDRDFRRRRTRSRSFSPRRRDYDTDRRRRFDDRPRFSPERRWGRRRTWSRSPRRNRSPLDRGPRIRSRSPRLRSRSPRDRYRPMRSRTKSRSPRPRSWSRPGSGGRLRTRSPSNTRQPDSRGSTPLQDNDFISSTNDLPTVTSTVGSRSLGDERLESRLPAQFDGPPLTLGPSGRTRCQNFEEKGFCMLGDVCPFDHGSDPVVVEDVPISAGTTAASVPSTAGGFVPPDLRVPPPGHMAVRVNLQHPPPIHEPYIPEAAGLRPPLRPPFLRGPPPDLRQPPPGIIINRPPLPDPFFPGRREVILNRPPIPLEDRVDAREITGPEGEPSRIVIPSKRPYSAIDNVPNAVDIGPPPPRMPHINQHHQMFSTTPQQPPMTTPSQGPPPAKRGFDYNRLGIRASLRSSGARQPFRAGNVTLEVRKIPAEMNNIAKLNEHFGKFGTLTNIQVKFQGDPGAALISYSSPSEATAAYRSPEPVFNNRFIKLFWHNAEKHLNLDGETESPVVITVGDEGREVQMQQTTVTGGRVGDGIDHPSLMLPVRPTIPPAHKLQLDNTKPKPGTTTTAASTEAISATTSTSSPSEKSIVYTSSVGNLKKTVFNPTATGATTPTTSKAKPATPFVSPTAVKTADHISRIEAIKRAEEDRKLAAVKQVELEKKKQELLAKQIQQQKVLLDALEKKKGTMSDEEKKGLLQSLRVISDAIDKVKYGTGAKKPQTAAFQVPAPAQFKYVSSLDQSRKEILDLELEVMTKQNKGEDITALRMKLQDLANKATAAVAPPAPALYGRGRGWASGRGGSWGPRGRGRGMAPVVGRTHLDNRPKTIEVKGFDLSELEEIKSHFQRFGEIDKLEVVEEIPSAFFTYSARPSAEVAVSQGGKFKKKTLIVRWNQITPKITRTESTQSSELDEDLSVTLGSLDDDALLDMSGEDRSSDTIPLHPRTPQNMSSEKDSSPGMTGNSSSVFLENSSDPAINSSGMRSTTYERSLSEDLLGEEENFKASYTDDEDEEDHITVTLSNTTSFGQALYTSGEYSNVSGIKAQDGEDEDDLSNLENTDLDYNEDDNALDAMIGQHE